MDRMTTAGQRWRRRRNIAIGALHRAGVSLPFIADVFDLPRSRVSEVVREVLDGSPFTPRGPDALNDPSFRSWIRAALANTSSPAAR